MHKFPHFSSLFPLAPVHEVAITQLTFGNEEITGLKLGRPWVKNSITLIVTTFNKATSIVAFCRQGLTTARECVKGRTSCRVIMNGKQCPITLLIISYV